MARATNAFTQGLSGKIGGIVFRRQSDGTPPIVAAAPSPSTKPPTPGATANRAHFRWATQFADLTKKPGPVRDFYSRPHRKRRNSFPYRDALSDARIAPQVTKFSLPPLPLAPGQVIQVWATDNYEVVRLHVRLEAPDGTLLEADDARPQSAPSPATWWLYAVRQPIGPGTVLVATAYDFPGNATEARWPLA